MNSHLPYTRVEKLVVAARYWLLGAAQFEPEYYKVIEALEAAIKHHDGKRNGGQPAYIHQLEIFHLIRTLHRHLRNPVIVYTLIFLHDIVEDPRTDENGQKIFFSLEDIERGWGHVIAVKVKKLSKEILGVKNPDYSLDEIFEDEDCSIAKAGDRVNNVSTMYGVFKPARLERYVKETADEFLHRIKGARRRFPDQEGVFENMKLELVHQLQLIGHLMENTNGKNDTTESRGPG